MGNYRVPIVPAAVIFDLMAGDGTVRPDAAMGYAALEAAGTEDDRQGAVGAGTGATIGKLIPGATPTRGGIGMSSMQVGGATIAALIVANPAGDVYDGDTLIASGSIDGQSRPILREAALMAGAQNSLDAPISANTVIGILATDALLTKEEANRLAEIAQDGIALSVRPAHTPYDGDTLFCASTGNKTADFALLTLAAPLAVARAMVNAARAGA